MTESRFGIRPFPRVATYPTLWGGEMSFEQISEDISPRAAKMLIRQYCVWPQDMPDCLQNGLMYIWQQLVEDHEFLAKMTIRDAAIVVCHRSKSTSIRKQNLRYEYMEDFWAQHDFKHPEEMSDDSGDTDHLSPCGDIIAVTVSPKAKVYVGPLTEMNYSLNSAHKLTNSN